MSLGLVAAAGTCAGLVATYWDDSWHTDRGRDGFAIPPHLLLYGGVLVAALAVVTWGVHAWRSAGWKFAGIRHVLRDPALLLAGIGGVVTLASAPIDNMWHAKYGRDAVLWSPPHLTAVVGSLALSVGILAGLRNSRGRGVGLAQLFAAAGVIGALQVPVLEYDSDVPQFSSIWFLPVAALGLCVAAALLDDLLPGRWTPAIAGLIYTGVRVLAVALLAVLGFSLTSIPPIPILLLLTSAWAARPLGLRLVVLGGVSPIIWWPFLRLQDGIATEVPIRQLPAAVFLGGCAGLAVAVAHGDVRLRRPARAAVNAVIIALLIVGTVSGTSGRASAHDPGQGTTIRDGHMTVDRKAERANIKVELTGPCGDLQSVRTVARRAGNVRSGPLTLGDNRGSSCTLTGSVDGLSAGRWFVYAELRGARGRQLEMWLPAEPGTRTTDARALYEPPVAGSRGSRDLVGAGLLLVIAGLLVACLRLGRRAAATTSPTG